MRAEAGLNPHRNALNIFGSSSAKGSEVHHTQQSGSITQASGRERDTL